MAETVARPDVTISLTQFMDFLNATGTAKASCVERIARYQYEPKVDFWRSARRWIIEHARGVRSADDLRQRMTDRPETAPPTLRGRGERLPLFQIPTILA